ncbi:hypothetical protein NMY22_g1296 [Coprinellus aureogranulatus]|nr:hypothetical protein NMY22_g1296 [Coprinellus aureogranulatus]
MDTAVSLARSSDSHDEGAMANHLAHGAFAIFLAIFVHIFYRVYDRRKRSRGCPFPPGPEGLPFLGNIRDLGNANQPWLGYSSLANHYGDIMYLEALGTGVLILSSLTRANELLEGRSSKYSDRPKCMGLDIFFALLPYGKEWRRARRTFHKHFSEQASPQYHPIIESLRNQCLKDLLADPLDFARHTKNYSNRVMVKSGYGIHVKDQTESYISKMQEVSSGFQETGTPGRFLVDVIPAMRYIPRWMPGAGWRKWADYYRNKAIEARDGAFDIALNAYQEGRAEVCMVTSMIDDLPPPEEVEKRKEEETTARNVASILYFAGSDTTQGSGLTLILAMGLHLNVQKRAQQEIDRVVGTTRLPTFEDRPNLVYVNAVLYELFRWHQLGPLGLPHATSEDDIYDGYFIPKGTIVMANIWHILHDEANFTNSFDFDPDRWIKNGKLDQGLVEKFGELPFGFGRRICPGRFMGMDAVYLFAVSVLASYNIAPTVDEHGGSKLKATFSGRLLPHPDPYEVTITPRSTHHEQLIRDL